MAKKQTKQQRVIFKDGTGRFVKAEDRYKKATTVQVLRRGKYVTVINKSEVTPQRLAQVTSRPEFESLPAAFKHVKSVKPPKGRASNKTWEISQTIAKTRGVRDKLIKITAKFKAKSGEVKKVSFFHKIPRKKRSDYVLFKRLKEATEGIQLPYYYDITEADLSKLTKDKVKIVDIEIEEVM